MVVTYSGGVLYGDMYRGDADMIGSLTYPYPTFKQAPPPLIHPPIYLRCPSITHKPLNNPKQNAPFEIRVSLDLLRANAPNQQLKGLVLDLRGNPGGLLTSAVDVASQLVPRDSEIVSAKYVLLCD